MRDKSALKSESVLDILTPVLLFGTGMSTFSSRGGLYERAQKRYKLSEGKKLFTYPFFERQKLDAQVSLTQYYFTELASDHWSLSKSITGFLCGDI